MTQSEVAAVNVEEQEAPASEPIDVDPIAQKLEAFEQQLAAHEARLYDVANNVRGVQGRADSAHTTIASLQSDLEERFAPKRALNMLERAVRSSLGDEVWEQYKKDDELETRLAKAERRPAPAPVVQADPQAAAVDAWLPVWSNLDRIAKKQGFTGGYTEVIRFISEGPNPIKSDPAPGDKYGFIKFQADAEARIEEEADKRFRKTRTVADSPANPGGGSGGGRDSLIAAYSAGELDNDPVRKAQALAALYQ